MRFRKASTALRSVRRGMGRAVVLPKSIAKLVEREARRLGISVEEYLAEVLSAGLDSAGRAREYIKVAEDLLAQAREELAKGDTRQAAEKLWGATALAIKAYAYWRENRGLVSHRELWEYKDRVAEELGSWVRETFREASAMHQCFYEGMCTARDVEDVLKNVEKLIEAVEKKMSTTPQA